MAKPSWMDASVLPPEKTPVIAEYREWGHPLGKKRTHTVWFFDGGWRCYPDTSGSAYVDRWRLKEGKRLD